MEDLKKKMLTELESFKSAEKEYKKAISTRKKLDAQLNENLMVKSELDLLNKEAVVYRSYGPVLIQEDIVLAKETVAKRIDFINGELNRVDKAISVFDQEQNGHREGLLKLQQQLQQMQMKSGIGS